LHNSVYVLFLDFFAEEKRDFIGVPAFSNLEFVAGERFNFPENQ